MRIEFKRDDLYEEVWSTPLTTLARRYGLSDNGLRKICKAMNIPLPVSGHWAKVAAGHEVERKPLPPEALALTYLSDPPKKHVTEVCAEDEEWRGAWVRFESLQKNAINVNPQPSLWHPVLVPFRNKLRNQARRIADLKREVDRKKANPNRKAAPELNFAGLDLHEYERRGLIDTHKAIPIRVFMGTYERALAIMNTLFFEAEKRGLEVSYDERVGRFHLDGHSADIDVRIVERTVKRIFAGSELQELLGANREYVPTGILRLSIEGRAYNSYEIADETDAPLESRLNFAFLKIYQMAVYRRQLNRKNALSKKRQEEGRRFLAEQERKRNEAEQLKKNEQQRKRLLMKEVINWQRAERIRAYVAHVARLAESKESSGEQNEWMKWALQVADGIDESNSHGLE